MTNQQLNQSTSSVRVTLGLCLFLIVAGFFLWTEHRAHLFGILPSLILLACPLIHLLMHGGHGGHRQGDATREGTRTHGHGEAS